jgi:hypothetical protein
MNRLNKCLRVMTTPRKVVISRGMLALGGLILTASLAAPLWAAPFFFATGRPDGGLGALSRRPSPGNVETETADDFFLSTPTVITHATIFGLLPAGMPLSSIKDVEVEVYRVFPLDSAPASGRVPVRVNSPSDVEIGTATRSRSAGTLSASATIVNAGFTVNNTVANGISLKTGGEGPLAGEEVEIDITFTSPIILASGSYFFRPEVLLTDEAFLYLSGPRPIVSPAGTPFTPDRQAWIRNSNLAPDWLRIGTDIIDGATPPTFNMAFSLSGQTVPDVGTPGQPNCHGQSISGLAHQFGGIDASASALGFSSVGQLQAGFALFCE